MALERERQLSSLTSSLNRPKATQEPVTPEGTYQEVVPVQVRICPCNICMTVWGDCFSFLTTRNNDKSDGLGLMVVMHKIVKVTCQRE